jgi:hypothetical protein
MFTGMSFRDIILAKKMIQAKMPLQKRFCRGFFIYKYATILGKREGE